MAQNFFAPLVSACALAAAGLIPLSAVALPPVILDPLSTDNGAPRVEAKIPVGKTLVLPLAASTDPAGGILSFTVRSSNPKIMARVRTGCPILKIHASYAGDGTTAAFAGDLEFQLFRDATPVTSGIIGGAAQAGFYDNLIFHRVAFLPGFHHPRGRSNRHGLGKSGLHLPARVPTGAHFQRAWATGDGELEWGL
jgi:hypothetical protein